MLEVKKGSTSRSVYLFLPDAASSAGAGKTGLAFNTAGLVAAYVRNGAAAAAITLATQTAAGAWASGGFVEVDAALLPGVYRLDIPNAVLATGVPTAVLMLTGAGIVPTPLRVNLVSFDPENGANLGLSDLAAVTGQFAALQAHGDASWSNFGATGGQFVDGKFRADSVTTATDPGSGQLRWNNATQASATALYLDRLGYGGADVQNFFAQIVPGDTVYLQDEDDASKAQNWTVISRTDNTGWWTINVSPVWATGGNIANGQVMRIRFSHPMSNADIAAIKAKTDNLPSDPADASDIAASFATVLGRLPAALVSGRMSSQVGAMGANVITAASTAPDYSAEIANTVWDEALGFHVTTGSAGMTLLTTKITTDQLTFTGGNVNANCVGGGEGGLDAAGVRAAIGMASPNLDTQLAAIKSDTTKIPADPLDSTDIAGLATSAEVAAVKADTAAIKIDSSAIKAKTDQLSFTSGSVNANCVNAGEGNAEIDAALVAIKGDTAAIKSKTDGLTFTVPGVVDSNITHVIADAVRRDGSNDTNWGGQP